MWPGLVISRSGSVSAFEAAVVLAVVGVSFWWWREMRLDCDEEKMLAGMWRLGLFLAVALWLVRKIPGVQTGIMWLVTVGWWWRWCRYNKWDIWEWLDVMVPSLLLAGSGVNFAWGPKRLEYGAGYLAVWVADLVIARVYRNFKWYKSGRVGFVGLAGLGLWALVELVVEIRRGNGIYWVGLTIEQWLAVWIFTAALVTIYLRSGRKITRDLPILARRTKT